MNYDVYNAQMVKSSYDKLGFVDKAFDIEVIVDFGCADGAITEMIKSYFPDATVIGYDKFQKNTSTSDIIYIDKFSKIKKCIKGKKALLVMNSVVHEIYNYEKNPFSLLGELFSMGFEYIWIRDLYIKPYPWKVDDALDDFSFDLRAKFPSQVKDFEDKYGSIIINPKNVMHFLMKFRYVENWKREVAEDYALFKQNFPYMIDLLKSKGYKEEYSDYYVLPYVDKINKDDFGIKLSKYGYTHFKGLFKRT